MHGGYVTAREVEGGGSEGGERGDGAIICDCSVFLVWENGTLLIRLQFTPL